MGFDDEEENSSEWADETEEVGSDELLASDTLRLPEHASVLVRLHALRAWLTRRQEEAKIALGEAAMALQQAMQEPEQVVYSRRRNRLAQAEQRAQVERGLATANAHLRAYENAQELLEDCVDHTTTGERALVEYYLTLDMLLQQLHNDSSGDGISRAARIAAFSDVLHRVEHVSSALQNDE
jgi:thioredoxin-like negative regulator of GroEL